MRRPARDPDEVLRRVSARRLRHRRRPKPVRVLAALAGALLAVAGAVLLVPLPEGGLPLLVGGLSLLALEYAWAVRALVQVLSAAERARQWLARRSAGTRAGLVLASAGLLALIVWAIL